MCAMGRVDPRVLQPSGVWIRSVQGARAGDGVVWGFVEDGARLTVAEVADVPPLASTDDVQRNSPIAGLTAIVGGDDAGYGALGRAHSQRQWQ